MTTELRELERCKICLSAIPYGCRFVCGDCEWRYAPSASLPFKGNWVERAQGLDPVKRKRAKNILIYGD